MDFRKDNEKERLYFKQNFNSVNELIKKIRTALFTGTHLTLDDINISDVIDFQGEHQFFFVTIFQEHKKQIRYGSKRQSLEETLNRVIKKLRTHPRFDEFEINNPSKTRILLEYIVEREKVNISQIHEHGNFDKNRFEAGITGIEMKYNDNNYIYLPTDCPVLNHLYLSSALTTIANKTGLFTQIKKQRDKINALKSLNNAEFYITKSKAFVTYETTVLPLYRGNVFYDRFDYDIVLNIFKSSNDALIANMDEDGKFMYYYNPTEDNNIDHEHPKRRPPNLYYNDLRHCGGTISLLRMYELTRDMKYLSYIKKAIDWIIRITEFHEDLDGNEAAYVYANEKAKLGGVGIALIMLMRYRLNTNDKSYDRYIEAYSRHLISRIAEDGEFMGYYIHPLYNDGQPLISMTDEERMQMFSFYYPGEALMGLAMVVHHYNENKELISDIITKSKIAMRWIIDKRPLIYKDQFTTLPSDSWLMQAIEEWSYCENFLEENDINFVFNDAETMMQKTYKKDDSPYIDYEGGMYYKYGDHYYPDGARCEGLIAAYYLAKRLNKHELADKILDFAKKAARCQFTLFISKYNNFAHRNPKKSENLLKFKATRQWNRVDAIQHVNCFFIRLYWSENKYLGRL